VSRIGFIGLGVMGAPMAGNLVAAGHDVAVHSRRRSSADAVVAAGATWADSAAAAAAGRDVVITMLPDSPQVQGVFGPLLAATAGGEDAPIFVDMSTISPLVARALADDGAAKGVAVLDAPVSGGDVGARAGTLSIMVGGDADAFAAVRPVFEALGKTITHVGPAGAGQIVKACNQIVVAITIQAVSEALVLGAKAGVAPELVLDVLQGGLAANKVIELRRRNFLEHDFPPGFRARLHAKDLAIALECARAYEVALPASAGVTQLFNALIANGHGDDDHSALLTELERMGSHVTRRP